MTQEEYKHPIVPPPELMRHWARFQGDTDPEALWFRIATEAAQWGSDQELEACVKWLDENLPGYDACEGRLRAARRPKPPSLKQRALEAMHRNWNPHNNDDFATISRALEQLDD